MILPDPRLVDSVQFFRRYRLVKYCNRQHNVALGCPTLQVGTLEYYRQFESTSPLSDPAEGHRSIRLTHGNTIAFSQQRSYRLFGPNVQLSGLGRIEEGGKIQVGYEVSNCLLFCCTWYHRWVIPSLDAGKSLGSYDSMYELDSPHALADILARPLMAEYRRILMNPPSTPLGMLLLCRYGEVSYHPEKTDEISLGDVDRMPPWEQRLFWACAFKDSKFSYQREFRFIWEFLDQSGQMLVPRAAPVVLEPGSALRDVSRLP